MNPQISPTNLIVLFILIAIPLIAKSDQGTWSFYSEYGNTKAEFDTNQLPPNSRLNQEIGRAAATNIGIKPFNMDGSLYGWILVKKPSKPKSFGRGYCGAGTEDYVYLVKIQKKYIKYIDKTIVQSCLSSINIEGVDSGETKIEEALNKNNEFFLKTIRTDAENTYRSSVKIIPTPSKIIRIDEPEN